MPLQSTSGAASYDAFGGGAAAKVNYIEDFFQSYLRTGTGASATVTTGLDGSTKETLVWTKSRSAATNHKLTDNVRGATKALSSNTTGAEATDSQGLTAFSATGYTIGTNTDYNNSGATYVDWQWVAQPKFFDVVTWTADSSGTGQAVSHNLGSIPGCIIVKATNFGSSWFTWHIATDITVARTGFQLNSTAASALSVNSTGQMTSTEFFSGQIFDSSYNRPVTDGTTYVAYVFAHNAGGFGLTGTDNVISCGSFTTNSNGEATVSLGYEPQWMIAKRTDSTGNWFMIDTMRGWNVSGNNDVALFANTSAAEVSGSNYGNPTATGFFAEGGFANSASYIYIAIRRGPMKVPTSGTSVFYPTTYTGTGVARTFSGFGFPPDFEFSFSRGGSAAGDGNGSEIYDKLRGTGSRLLIPSTAAEFSGTEPVTMIQDGISVGATTNSYINANGFAKVLYALRRAPSYFDEVCYTGDSNAGRTLNHNLTVVPELMIVKNRSFAVSWVVYSAAIGATNYLILNNTAASTASSFIWNNTAPTSSVFTVDGFGGNNNTNFSGRDYVAYLFATCAGVSKVGSYTGNGSTQTIDCGFTGGARFVLLKATSTTGNWMVYDTARGMTTLTDPFLSLNSTSAETATLGACTTVSTGFAVNESILAGVNTNGVSFVYLAIA